MRARIGLPLILLSLVLAAPATAAAPRYMLISGPKLAQPELFDDWSENAQFLFLVANAPRLHVSARVLSHRPRYDIAMFWGWTDLQRPTRPSDANQHGWFYPAHRKLRPIVDLMVEGVRVPRRALPSVLEIFARHGVATQL
jgi:hypothetical protein